MKNNTSWASVSAVDVMSQRLSYQKITGRWLTSIDLQQKNQVVLLSKALAKSLFPQRYPHVLKQSITLNSVPFTVVGVIAKDAGRPAPKLFIPLTLAKAFGGDFAKTGRLTLLTNQSWKKTPQIQQKILTQLSQLYHFDPKKNALVVANNAYKRLQKGYQLGTLISHLNHWVGVLSLLSSLFGMGNMLLLWLERDRAEISLQRAFGASLGQILIVYLWQFVFCVVLSLFVAVSMSMTLMAIINHLNLSLQYFAVTVFQLQLDTMSVYYAFIALAVGAFCLMILGAGTVSRIDIADALSVD